MPFLPEWAGARQDFSSFSRFFFAAAVAWNIFPHLIALEKRARFSLLRFRHSPASSAMCAKAKRGAARAMPR
jgi:hypothetical protein